MIMSTTGGAYGLPRFCCHPMDRRTLLRRVLPGFACFLTAILSPAAHGYAQEPAPILTDGGRPTVASFDGSPFAAARRLSQEGKHEEALSALLELQTKSPGLKGLEHEFGT